MFVTALLAAIAWAMGEYYEVGPALVPWAIGFSGVSAAFSYYKGDAVALWSAGARPVARADAPQLYTVVENLSIASGLPMPKVYLIHDPAPNAFTTGRDPQHASIAFTTGLVERLEKSELEGVAAHEMGHIQNYDIRLTTIVVVLVGAIVMLSDIFWRSRWHGGGRSDRRRESGGKGNAVILVVGLVLMILAPLIAKLIQLAISRRREYLADASGALLTRYPEGLARALEKIATYAQPMATASNATAHLFIADPFGATKSFFTHAFDTHPPMQDRVQKLRAMIGQG